MADVLYPPVGFFYAVRLAGSRTDNDSQFKEVSGLSVEMALKEVGEGGENRFRHRVPEVPRYTNLVLKRGLVVAEQGFYAWCKDTLQNNLSKPIKPQSIQVVLLNEQSQPLKTWTLTNAWPVKWAVSDFNSMDGQVVIETLEMAYQYFDVS
jgi:phage tail-like protein